MPPAAVISPCGLEKGGRNRSRRKVDTEFDGDLTGEMSLDEHVLNQSDCGVANRRNSTVAVRALRKGEVQSSILCCGRNASIKMFFACNG